MFRVERFAMALVADHRVEDSEEFACDGNQGDGFRLSGRDKGIEEAFRREFCRVAVMAPMHRTQRTLVLPPPMKEALERDNLNGNNAASCPLFGCWSRDRTENRIPLFLIAL